MDAKQKTEVSRDTSEFLSEQDSLQRGAEDVFFAFAAETQALDSLDIPLDIRRLGVGEVEAEYAA